MIGSHTPGLGCVYEHIPLPDGAALSLRTGYFQRPDGRSLVGPQADDPDVIIRRLAHQVRSDRGGDARQVKPESTHGIAPDHVTREDPIVAAAAQLSERLKLQPTESNQ